MKMFVIHVQMIKSGAVAGWAGWLHSASLIPLARHTLTIISISRSLSLYLIHSLRHAAARRPLRIGIPLKLIQHLHIHIFMTDTPHK